MLVPQELEGPIGERGPLFWAPPPGGDTQQPPHPGMATGCLPGGLLASCGHLRNPAESDGKPEGRGGPTPGHLPLRGRTVSLPEPPGAPGRLRPFPMALG